MKFAIIAAGEGSRLTQEGAPLPKPLIKLNGISMIDRLIRIFIRNGAESIVIIINNQSQLVKDHLVKLSKEYPLELVIKDTPSSMHSFYELTSYLSGSKFCLTTVDTIFREDEFKSFIEAFKNSNNDGYMAVTDFIDDEKPLYISTNSIMDITGFYDERKPETKYISGGIYCLTSSALNVLEECITNNISRMRNFQRELIKHKLELKAYPFSKIIDVDHVEDIRKAEAFLSNYEK